MDKDPVVRRRRSSRASVDEEDVDIEFVRKKGWEVYLVINLCGPQVSF